MKHTSDLHVLYIITKLELGGAQKVCLSLLNGLEQAQAHACLISGSQGPLVHTVKDKSNVILLEDMQRELSFKSIWHEIKCLFKIIGHIKKLKRQHPNLIVHTHSTKAGIIGRWAAFFAGARYRIHTVHGYAFHTHQSWLTWLAIYLCELVTSFITTHYICVSSEDVKVGITLFPRFKNKHAIIRAAVDIHQFTPAVKTALPEPKQHFIFGTIACFKKQKNLFDLLKAFALVHVQAPHTRLELIGDGALRPAIEAWIQQHNLQHVITLHGWQEHVAPVMLNWHAFVLSSLWEGLPCAIIEARLLKLPVLSYNTGGIHDVIIPGENGYLYKQGDWQSLANGMLELSRNTAIYTKLSNYADDLHDFDTQHMVHDHIKLYKRLAK